MLKAHSMSRIGLKAAAGLGAAVASLAFAGIASAAVQTITPDEPIGGSCPAGASSSSLTTAIGNATASTNTIVLTPGLYCPVVPTGQQTITIGHNLNIVGDHSVQGTAGEASFLINAQQVAGADNFTVNSGVTLTLEGIEIDNGGYNNGNYGGYTLVNNGTLLTWGTTFDGNFTAPIDNEGTATLDDSTVSDGLNDGILNDGTLTLQDDSLVNNTGNALDQEGVANAYDTLIAQNGNDCFFGGVSNAPAPGSLDDDGSCGMQYSDKTGVDGYIGTSAPFPSGRDNTDGGPETTTELNSNAYTTGKGNSTYCFAADARFFVNPVSGGNIQCDIGSVTTAATRETAGPTCKVTGGTAGVSQQVTLADSGGGIGPEIGLDTDNPSNTIATTYPPLSAVPVAGYDVDNLQVTNASVSFTSPTAPQASVVLTAGNKTTPGVNNSMWSFTGLNWAGVATNCY